MPLNDIVSMLQAGPGLDWTRLMQGKSEQEAALGEMLARAREAQTQAEALKGQFQTEQAAPAPQTNPYADFAARLSGGVADVLNPRGNAKQGAEDLIKQAKAEMVDRRKARLQFLEKSYEEQAAQAMKLGDLAGATKLQLSAEKYSKAYEALLDNERLRLSSKLAGENAAASDARQAKNALALERVRQQGELTIENVRGKNALDRAELAAENARLRAGWTWNESTQQAEPPPAGAFVPDRDVLAHIASTERLATTVKDPKQREAAVGQLVQAVVQPMRSEAKSPAAYAKRLAAAKAPFDIGGLFGMNRRMTKGTPLFSDADIARSVMVQYPETQVTDAMVAFQRATGRADYDVAAAFHAAGFLSDEDFGKFKAPTKRK